MMEKNINTEMDMMFQFGMKGTADFDDQVLEEMGFHIKENKCQQHLTVQGQITYTGKIGDKIVTRRCIYEML